MGNICGSTLSEAEKEERQASKKVEELNKTSYETETQKIKLLLLGAGESGKSTLFKQMKILYGKGETSGFNSEERAEMKSVVHQNIIFNLKQLLCAETFNLQAEFNNEDGSKGRCTLPEETKNTAVELMNIDTRQNSKNSKVTISKELAAKIKNLWKDEVVIKQWNNRGDLQVQDALEYYLDEENFARIVEEEYIPTDQDILRSRVRTSGIVEEEFLMGGNTFVMVDVGGQRNERRKWIHAFEDVDCVIFVAAISEFNQVLYEDNSVKRQEESLELFGKVAKEEVFQNNGLVLFLNKSDLFRKKLLSIPFRVDSGPEKQRRNQDYTGPVVEHVKDPKMSEEEFELSEEFEEIYLQSLHYLEALYKRKVPPGKQVFVKATCATDTQQVEHIMNACREVFMKRTLMQTGFM